MRTPRKAVLFEGDSSGSDEENDGPDDLVSQTPLLPKISAAVGARAISTPAPGNKIISHLRKFSTYNGY